MESVIFSNNGSKYSEILVCDICCNHFDCDAHTPLVLTCGHTFCKKCIDRLFQNVAGLYRMKCPKCNFVITSPIRNVFQKNFSLIQMIDDQTQICFCKYHPSEKISMRCLSCANNPLLCGECVNDTSNVHSSHRLGGAFNLLRKFHVRSLEKRLTEEINQQYHQNLDKLFIAEQFQQKLEENHNKIISELEKELSIERKHFCKKIAKFRQINQNFKNELSLGKRLRESLTNDSEDDLLKQAHDRQQAFNKLKVENQLVFKEMHIGIQDIETINDDMSQVDLLDKMDFNSFEEQVKKVKDAFPQ